MSSIINALLVVGLLFGGVVLFQNRCSILGLCGEGLFGTASAAPAATGETVINNYLNDPESTENTGTQTGGKSGCCTCEMQGDRVKCHRGDNAWFNPPAGPDGSNDQDVNLSLKECNKGCGGNTIPNNGTEDDSKPATQQKKVATGSAGNPGSDTKGVQNKNNSVTGSGQKINPPKTTSTGKPNPYASYVNANPGGYKPGGGTYFAQAYFNSIRRNNSLALSLNGYKLSSF
jgi:hypothetical protein